MKASKFLLAAAVAAAAITSSASAVEVVFSQFGLTGTARNFRWVRGGTTATQRNASFYTTSTGTATSAGATAITFGLVGAPIDLPALPSNNFRLLMTGSTVNDAAVVTGSNFTQLVDNFTFTITSTSAFVYAPASSTPVAISAGGTVFSGTVQNSTISGALAGSTGTWSGSTAGGSTISFASPLFTFAPTANLAFAFTLPAVNPTFSVGANRALTTFRSQITGNFQSDPPPEWITVPEPATWLMLLAGFGMVGFAARRRKAMASASA